MKRTDWQIDEDGDELLDANGDYIEGPSNLQEAWEAANTAKGELAQFTTAGMNLPWYLRKKISVKGMLTPEKFVRELTVELEGDNQLNPQIIVSNDLQQLEINVE